MAGGAHTEQSQINWAERYIIELSKSMDSIKEDMRELRGMEGRLTDRMERMNENLNSRMERMNENLNSRMDRMDADLNATIDRVNYDLNAKIDTANKHTQILAVTVSIGILAAIITVVIAFGKSMGF